MACLQLANSVVSDSSWFEREREDLNDCRYTTVSQRMYRKPYIYECVSGNMSDLCHSNDLTFCILSIIFFCCRWFLFTMSVLLFLFKANKHWKHIFKRLYTSGMLNTLAYSSAQRRYLHSIAGVARYSWFTLLFVVHWSVYVFVLLLEKMQRYWKQQQCVIL